ncbi:MAG: hypothetical protein ACRECO_13855 [Xanthobacteraceae bacterium]
MLDFFLFAGAFAGGYALAVHTWPELRTFFVGMDQELAWLKERAAELEAKLRAVLGRDRY